MQLHLQNRLQQMKGPIPSTNMNVQVKPTVAGNLGQNRYLDPQLNLYLKINLKRGQGLNLHLNENQNLKVTVNLTQKLNLNLNANQYWEHLD